MKSSKARMVVLLAASLSGGCATYPPGPSVMALPGSGANFDQFQRDDMDCQVYAQQAAGMSTRQSGEKGAVDSAVVGTMVGAAAGALLGAASGDAAAGAAIGAGSGLIIGAASGSDAYGVSGARTQDRYDTAYVQCMYARGHQVPVPAGVAAARQAQPAPAYATPAPTSAPAPAPGAPVGAYPPPGTPPPPGY